MGERLDRHRHEQARKQPDLSPEELRQKEVTQQFVARKNSFIACAKRIKNGSRMTHEHVKTMWEEYADGCKSLGIRSEKSLRRTLLQGRQFTDVYVEQITDDPKNEEVWEAFIAISRTTPHVLLIATLRSLANHPEASKLCLDKRVVPFLQSRSEGRAILSKLSRVQFDQMLWSYYDQEWAHKLLLSSAEFQHPDILKDAVEFCEQVNITRNQPVEEFQSSLEAVLIRRYNTFVPMENARVELYRTRRGELKKLLRENEHANEVRLLNNDIDSPLPYLQIDPAWVESAQSSAGLGGDSAERRIEIARSIARQKSGPENVTVERVQQVTDMIKRTTDAVSEIPVFQGRNVIVLAADPEEDDTRLAVLHNDATKAIADTRKLIHQISTVLGDGDVDQSDAEELQFYDPETWFFPDAFKEIIESQQKLGGSLQVFRGSKSRTDAIDALIHTAPPLTIIYSGHGSPNTSSYGITPDHMAYVIAERDRIWGLKKMITTKEYYKDRPIQMMFCCHGAEFERNQQKRLRLITGSNKATANEPMCWSEAEYGQFSHVAPSEPLGSKTLRAMVDYAEEHTGSVIQIDTVIQSDPRGKDNPTFSVPYKPLPGEDENEFLLQISKKIDEIEEGQV